LSDDAKAFVHSFGTNFCAALQPCCTQYDSTFDLGVCDHAAEQLFLTRLAIGLLSSGPGSMPTLQFNSAYAPVCLSELKGFADACGASTTQNRPFPESCDQVLTGPGKPGDPCDQDTNGCSPPPNGDGKAACSGDGKCEWVFPAQPGESCEQTMDLSHVGECDSTAGVTCPVEQGVCVAPPPTSGLGEACASCSDASCTPCGAGLVCDGAHGICSVPGKAGDACHDPLCSGPCPGAQCGDGLSCNASTDVCVPAGKIGESCGYVACATGLYCDLGHGCTPLGSPGDKCDVDSAPCVGGYGACKNGLCVAFGDPGAACNNSDDCPAGYFCDESQNYICAPLNDVGGKCRADYYCKPGNFCDCNGGDCFDKGTCAPKVALGAACPSFQDAQCQNGACWPTDINAALAGKMTLHICAPDNISLLCWAKSGSTVQ
jgi:hypothetical protein